MSDDEFYEMLKRLYVDATGTESTIMLPTVYNGTKLDKQKTFVEVANLIKESQITLY